MSHKLTAYLSDLSLIFSSIKWLYYQKNINQIILIHEILKSLLSFNSNGGLLYLISLVVDIILIKLTCYSCFIWDKPGRLWVGFSTFNFEGFCYCNAWFIRLCKWSVFLFPWLIPRKLWGFFFMFSNVFTLFSVLLLLPLSIIHFFVHSF